MLPVRNSSPSRPDRL